MYKKSNIFNIALVATILLNYFFLLVPITQAGQTDGSYGAYIYIGSMTPSPADSVLNVSGTAEGDVAPVKECAGNPIPNSLKAFTVTSPASYNIDGGSSSATVTLTVTHTGVGQNCGVANPPAAAWDYSFSFSINTSGLSTGSHTLTVSSQSGGEYIADSETFTIARGGTIAVSTNNGSATWSFPSSASNPCGTCSGISQTYTSRTAGSYTFSPGSVYATTNSPSSSANAGSSCSSSTVCNLGASSQVNFTSTYTATTCTVQVKGWYNASSQTNTGQSFTITGPSGSTNGTDNSGVQSFTLSADSSGTNYNFVVNSPQSGITLNGYVSTYLGVNNASQSCTPGQTILFTINYDSNPVLRIY